MDIRLGLTFDDVLLYPGESDVLPSQADTRTQVTRGIALNIPILSSAMDTVTEADMAIVMAQLGGIGVLHRNLTIEEQVVAVRQVKRFESGMVVNPITIKPTATLGEAQALMSGHRISGIPVVEADGKLVGILTNRDVRFAGNPQQPVSELMTHENLATVSTEVGKEEARRLLHARRIEKLLVVDAQYRCVGLITVKDIEKAVMFPDATKDEAGRLRVAAATTVGDKGFDRTEQLVDAGCDLIVIDTAHGHNRDVGRAVERVKKLSNSVQVVAGNVATGEATRALIGAGADGIKVGNVWISPGAILRSIVVLAIGLTLVRGFMRWLEGRYLPATDLDGSGRNSVSLVARYVGIALAVIWALASLGIGVERIALLLSALSGQLADTHDKARIIRIVKTAEIGIMLYGAAGMLTLFVRAMMCNWMVSTGVVGAMISTTVSGKVIAMWMPIMVFFYMTFEHSVVNMFLFPFGLMMGGNFSIGDYFFWNEIPTVLGNLVGGLTFVGLTLYATHYKTAAKRAVR